MAFNTPISIVNPATLLSSQSHSLSPTSFWGSLPAPYPTNTWWENLVLSTGDNPINSLPYMLKAGAQKLQVCMPVKTTGATSITTAATLENISFGCSETIASRYITGYTDLGVTMRWQETASDYFDVYMVKGMPYVTANYNNLIPVIDTQHAILTVNGSGTPGTTSSTNKFKITLNNGQTWIIYTSGNMQFTWTTSLMTATGSFTGTIRVAILTSASYETTLDTYKNAIPTGGSVNATYINNTATLTFTYTKTGSGTLLMMSLPHHRDILVSPNYADITINQMKGDMRGVIGDSWTMTETLTTISWNMPNSVAADKLSAIQTALNTDKTFVASASDSYSFGKEIAKMARLALIADQIGDTSAANSIRANMKTEINKWLNATNSNALKFESTYKGICTTNGLASSSADYGMGWYNDHHFHFGYFLYAAAVIGKADPTWLASYTEKVNLLARDIANPSATDSYFTKFRHKDWFDGHSWAAGLFTFGDSRNQESTSEAVNAYYGLYLWGKVIGNSDLENLGRLMLSQEIRTAKKYWQIKATDSIYGSPFNATKVVGVLWSNKVEYATFFGANVEYIHCIQMLPFTPISTDLLPPAWITEEYPILDDSLTRPSPVITDPWKGFVYMAHAIIDAESAWTEVNTLSSYDNGNSKTNTLYWVASLSQYSEPPTPPEPNRDRYYFLRYGTKPTKFAYNDGQLQKQDPFKNTWEDFTIKGINFAPTPPGFNPDDGRAHDPMSNLSAIKWFANEFSEAKGNTVRVYFNVNAQTGTYGTQGLTDVDRYRQALDVLYAHGIYAIVNIFVKFFTSYTTPAQRAWYKQFVAEGMMQAVWELKDHPAVLGWAFGNETNISTNLNWMSENDWWDFADDVAQQVKEVDPNHIVMVSSGGTSEAMIAAAVAAEDAGRLSHFDAHAQNVYRGADWKQLGGSGTTLWEEWDPVNEKPLIILEAGVDSYNNVLGSSDETHQAETTQSMWNLMDTSKCSGICFFSAFDELWKAGNKGTTPTNDGNYTNSYFDANISTFEITPDYAGNEQYFGWWTYITSLPDVYPPTAKEVVNLMKLTW